MPRSSGPNEAVHDPPGFDATYDRPMVHGATSSATPQLCQGREEVAGQSLDGGVDVPADRLDSIQDGGLQAGVGASDLERLVVRHWSAGEELRRSAHRASERLRVGLQDRSPAPLLDNVVHGFQLVGAASHVERCAERGIELSAIFDEQSSPDRCRRHSGGQGTRRWCVVRRRRGGHGTHGSDAPRRLARADRPRAWMTEVSGRAQKPPLFRHQLSDLVLPGRGAGCSLPIVESPGECIRRERSRLSRLLGQGVLGGRDILTRVIGWPEPSTRLAHCPDATNEIDRCETGRHLAWQ